MVCTLGRGSRGAVDQGEIPMSKGVKRGKKRATAGRKTSAARGFKRVVKAKAATRKPSRVRKGAERPARDEKGPLGWLLPDMESAYAPLVAREESAAGAAMAAGSATIKSSLAPKAQTGLPPGSSTRWRDPLTP